MSERSDPKYELREGKEALLIAILEVAFDIEVEPIDAEGQCLLEGKLRDPSVFISRRFCEQAPRVSLCALEAYMELCCGLTKTEIKNMGA